MRFTDARERPLLMSDPLVLQTEAGIKTVTRRIVNSQPNADGLADDSEPMEYGYAWHGTDGSVRQCRYGNRGDRLWLRHAHCPRYFDDGRTAYRCDWRPESEDVVKPPKWTPSIHMRREYARTVVELVSDPRVERLLDITDEEALAEGVPDEFDEAVQLGMVRFRNGSLGGRRYLWRFGGPRGNFLLLWDGINGKREIGGVVGAGRAEFNPWVWRLNYRVVVCNGVEVK